MKQKRTWRASNNNINVTYLFIPDYSISKKLDYITLSIYNDQHVKQIYSFLESNSFKLVSDLKLNRGNYDMKRTYRSDTDIASVEIIHGLKNPLPRYPSLLIKIHDPNEEFLSLLDSFFKYHAIEVNVSLIEFTFDFKTDDPIELFDFLKSHLFLKNIRTKPYSQYSSTFYTNNIRQSSKGMRVYLKTLKGDDKQVVRLELVLKRSIIKRLGLEFPLSNIDTVDLSKFFSFNFIDEERINKYLCWKHRKQIAEVEMRRKRFGGGIIKRIIYNGLRGTIGREESLMEKVGMLKSKEIVPNYSRFLEPLDGFNSDFFEMASRDHFIQSKPVLSCISGQRRIR